MKLMPKSGVMNLTLLILLSSLLLLFLLFDDERIRLQSALVSQRHIYVTQSIELQQQIQQEKRQVCASLSTAESGNVWQISRKSQRGDIQQFYYCKRLALFKQQPKSRVFEAQFDAFIDREKLSQFAPRFLHPQNGAQPIASQLYWFSDLQAQWEISGQVNGIIVAEGDLMISGKGKISGTVILGGQLTLSGKVTASYSATNVIQIVQAFSQWQFAENSWYDFQPE